MNVIENTSLRFEPVTGTVGAVINGLNIDAIDAAASASLTQALHHHGVLFYRPGAHALSDDHFVRLAEAFGDIFIYPYRGKDTSKADMRINFVDADSKLSKAIRTSVWHTDGSPEERPPYAALLNPVQLPPRGGDTMWASMYAAYEMLSPRYQKFLDGLEALHTTDNAARQMGEGADRSIFGKGAQCVHPVICTDPVTKRRMLYVNANYTERILGLRDAESASVLRMLFDHINTPEFHVRWQWQVNDVAIWEERVTQHRAVADFEGRRVLRRITLTGERPV